MNMLANAYNAERQRSETNVSSTRNSRKRKSPSTDSIPQSQPPAASSSNTSIQQHHHILPPLIHQSQQQHMQTYPLSAQSYSHDYTPGGINPTGGQPHHPQTGSESPPSGSGRPLSSTKRAEQNRKAQRAFRERRDQHVKQLEQRSQLLDAALASADEANRRWEECRTLVDQLRVENAALRATLSNVQQIQGSASANGGTEIKSQGERSKNSSESSAEDGKD